MYALTFFFMSWGPLSTVFVITAELFPTKWRATGEENWYVTEKGREGWEER